MRMHNRQWQALLPRADGSHPPLLPDGWQPVSDAQPDGLPAGTPSFWREQPETGAGWLCSVRFTSPGEAVQRHLEHAGHG